MGKGEAVSEDEAVASGYAQKVGERLRAVRKQKRLSLQAVEAESGFEFKASVLGAYERGERTISVPRLQRLARFYNVPVDQLLPKDGGGDSQATIDLRADDETVDVTAAGQAGRDRIVIDLTRLESLESPNRDLLGRYLRLIQVEREDFNGRVLTIRQDDLRSLATLFDTTPEAMRRHLDELGVRLHV
ncbi:MAG: transcriptional regulator [Actinobacteria bacterium]|nr:transcriptional regulator [Actinomycetota bacterium]